MMGILTDIREFFFPRICLGCGKRLMKEERGMCITCMSDLPFTCLDGKLGNAMEQVFWGRFPVERASALFYYAKEGNVARILYAMKYHGQRHLCIDMGRMMARELEHTSFFDNIDYLLPVPLSKARLRKRGYNQSEMLAQGISFKTGIPIFKNGLRRTFNNPTQTHKSQLDRWDNVDHLFQLLPATSALQGKHVLLIDDVLTTGATLTACADALSGVKDIRFSVLTLAWAR